MSVCRKLTDYVTGVAVVGAVAMVSWVLHALFPRHGHGVALSFALFDESFWIGWSTLMAVFGLVFAVWVFFLDKPNRHTDSIR